VRLNHRLIRLEQKVGVDPRCPACRERCGYTMMVTARQLPDGTTARGSDRPAPCEQCGEVPEQVIEIVRPLVETRESAVRPTAENWSPP
jgi:hypothetical protein